MKRTSTPLSYTLPLICIFILICCRESNPKINFEPQAGARIVIIGNTFAERLQHYNYLEPLLYKSFPDKRITVRNLGWSGDEINQQLRPLNFGSLDHHLTQQKADIIFACFGMNEAFDGRDSLRTFKQQLAEYLKHFQQQKFNGRTAPQVILVSPIAHEKLNGFLPDPSVHNENLALYTEAMEMISRENSVAFVDLYHPTLEMMKNKSAPLTINGIHLNENGYRRVSEEIAKILGLPVSWTPDLIPLKKVTDLKNKQFFYKFRAVNGEYIYGRRKEPWVQPPGGPISYPGEMRKLDSIVAVLDSLIWRVNRDPSDEALAQAHRTVNHTREHKAEIKITSSRDQFIMQDGFKIELFASEKNFPIANPVKITFDPEGRLWVATMPSYPQYYPGSMPDDKIVVLEDTNHDGKADRHTVFADSLYLPLGFELGNGGVYVTQPPDFLFLKDTDGDGRADKKDFLFHGFGTEDVHHSLSAHTWGQDGALYMHMGTFLHTQVETPYGPVRGAYGETYRYEPRTMKLEPYISYPYANPWGNVFMRDGTHLIGDVSTGMNYFAAPLTVATDYPKKHTPMKDFLTGPVKPKTCGMEIVSSRQFPDNAQGNVLFNTFIGFQGIRQHTITEDGSGITGSQTTPLLQSKDPNFRPVDLQFGPDGALYVVDWSNPIINHGERALRDPSRDNSHGRIWRVTYSKKKSLPVLDLSRLTIDKLLDQLKTYEDRVRYRTRIQLSNMSGEQVLPELDRWLDKLDRLDTKYEQHSLEGLWVYQQFNIPNGELLKQLLNAKDAHVRAAATRVLFYWRDRLENPFQTFVALAKDPSPKVRLQAIVALSHYQMEESVNALLSTTALPVDYYIDYSLKEAFKHLQPVWMNMFKTNKDFLAGEATQAEYLLKPLSSSEFLELPGFLQGDPDKHIYYRSPLSSNDYDVIGEATAVIQFRESVNRDTVSKTTVSENNKVIVHLSTLPGKMLFDQTVITVSPNKEVSIIFKNTDGMPHNVVIIRPGSTEKVGLAADAMSALKDGFEKSFVPELPEVLFYTPLVAPGESFELNFKTPSTPGDYPFICSFPGHWRIMKGVLKVANKEDVKSF
ncbi:MAG: PVC-type heme-binding CxxCH protein [Cyclobacteriaceae bacterium]